VALEALRTVHAEFKLDQPHEQEVVEDKVEQRAPTSSIDAVEVIQRLQGAGMEGLMIDEITLDDTQSRITLQKIPNQPGFAASLFERIADAGVFVDMIVQSSGRDQIADITFTVQRDQLADALKVAQAVSDESGCQGVDHKEAIAKLSVSGIGLRSHTGVAIAMFETFNNSGVNVEMVNTSEVQVNVVVDGADGSKGLQQLKQAFADSIR